MQTDIPTNAAERAEALAQAKLDLAAIQKAKLQYAQGKLIQTLTLGSGEMQRRYNYNEVTIETLDALESEYQERVNLLAATKRTRFRPAFSEFIWSRD